MPEVVDERPAGEAVADTMPSSLPDEPSRGHRRRRHHRPSVLWPLVLIGGGVLLLLSNLGYLPWQSWSILLRLWPLLLVAIGIDLLIGRRSLIGAVASALVIAALIGGAVVVALFAQNFPMLMEWTQTWEWNTEHVEYPLEGVEHATVNIDWTRVPGYLSALDGSTSLIEADVTYRGRLIFDVSARGSRADVRLDSRFAGPWFEPPGLSDRLWDVELSPEVALDLSLDAGSGPGEFDLTGLEIEGLALDAGSGPVDLILPSRSTFEAQIDGGSGPMKILLPLGVGGRVELDSGSGPFDPGERFRLVRGSRRGNGVWETADFNTAEHTVSIELDQGSGPISVH